MKIEIVISVFVFLFFSCISTQEQKETKSTNTIDTFENLIKNYESPSILKDIIFAINSDKLFSSSDSTLNILVSELKTNKKEILIVGYTDNQGSQEYNKRLSLKRAEAIKKYLIDKGIGKERISAFGRGDENPIGDNNTEQGRTINRRIEYHYKK